MVPLNHMGRRPPQPPPPRSAPGDRIAELLSLIFPAVFHPSGGAVLLLLSRRLRDVGISRTGQRRQPARRRAAQQQTKGNGSGPGLKGHRSELAAKTTNER